MSTGAHWKTRRRRRKPRFVRKTGTIFVLIRNTQIHNMPAAVSLSPAVMAAAIAAAAIAAAAAAADGRAYLRAWVEPSQWQPLEVKGPG